VLGECVDQGPKETLCERFHRQRYSDVSALTAYAEHVLGTSTTTNRSEKIASVTTTILMQTCQRLGLIDALWSDKSFGAGATDVVPYRQLLETWKRQSRLISPVGRMVGYTIDLAIRMRWVMAACLLFGAAYILFARQ